MTLAARRRRSISRLAGLLVLAWVGSLACLAQEAVAQSGGGYQIVQGTVSDAGGTSSGGSYSVAGTQGFGTSSRSMSGGRFCLDGGNWSGLRPAGSCEGFYAVTPCRIYDSRLTGGALVSGTTRVIPVVATPCGLPSWAHSVAVNVTAVSASASGSLTLFPASTPIPSATGTLSFRAASARANNVVMRLGLGGQLAASPTVSGPSGGTVHLVMDVTGYFIGGGS